MFGKTLAFFPLFDYDKNKEQQAWTFAANRELAVVPACESHFVSARIWQPFQEMQTAGFVIADFEDAIAGFAGAGALLCCYER